MNDITKSNFKKSGGQVELPLWVLMDLPSLGQHTTPLVVANFNKKKYI